MIQSAPTLAGLPDFCGDDAALDRAMRDAVGEPLYLPESDIAFDLIGSACAIALHMHQPLLPAGGADLRTAALIGNLQHMLEYPHVGDNHNAPVFLHCYRRMGEFIPKLVAEGRSPRVMLDYSGTLLHGLTQMGRGDVIDTLRPLACDARYRRHVEWLGTAWGHAVAPSTPVQDFRLHVRAWRQHFAALFGLEAAARVCGFSPPEMALPNHPDVAYEFVKTLRECGYRWVLVQEHSVELAGSGAPVERRHLPHRLVCVSSTGERAEIVALVKTQGSDTKLVGQMQPYYEAKGLGRLDLAGRAVPPLVTQIADGENGGVMMNEFPPKFMEVVGLASGSSTPLMNGSEYLEHLFAAGVQEADLAALQPVQQQRIWQRMAPGDGPQRLAQVIAELRREDGRFGIDGGSWTADRSWVAGYDNVLGPMEQASVLFHERASRPGIRAGEHRYRNALYHLLASQTSCYRYWGQGLWTDYGREICRRAQEILKYDFPA